MPTYPNAHQVYIKETYARAMTTWQVMLQKTP